MTSNIRKLLRAACLLALLSGIPRARADETAADASRAAAADGGSDAAELQRLRSRIAALERQITEPRNDAQAELLRQLNSQLAAVRAQLSQAQATDASAQAALQLQRQQLQESVAMLFEVQQRLASGDYDVSAELDGATPGLPPPAQEKVLSARVALEREDLAAARYFLRIAIGLAERAQLAR
jgi:ABC-type transporter Mla subunit MlaD